MRSWLYHRFEWSNIAPFFVRECVGGCGANQNAICHDHNATNRNDLGEGHRSMKKKKKHSHTTCDYPNICQKNRPKKFRGGTSLVEAEVPPCCAWANLDRGRNYPPGKKERARDDGTIRLLCFVSVGAGPVSSSLRYQTKQSYDLTRLRSVFLPARVLYRH